MRILYFDCFSGASGDMLLAALLDAGASEAAVRVALEGLQLEGWELEVTETRCGSLRARRAEVVASPGRSRTHSDIRDLLQDAAIEPGVRERALRAFELLARAEASVHGVDEAEVHFHEVGAVDAIVDIVAVSAALEDLAPELIVCSEIVTGTGMVDTDHGPIPIPGPAVVELLPGAALRVSGRGELLTPTGAALLASNVDRFGEPPAFRLTGSGYGAGARDTEHPNVLRVLVGDVEGDAGTGPHLLIETNLDDMSPELIPYVLERLLSSGAQDAWTSPIGMKKGRAGVMLSALVTSETLDAVLAALFTETTTLGVRLRGVGKRELQRTSVTVQVEGYDVRLKKGTYGGRVTTVAPEYEDAVKVARITGLPLKEVYRRALEADPG